MEQIIRLSQLQFNRPGSDFPSLHLFPRKVCDCISPGWQLSREEMTESAGGLQPSKSGKKITFLEIWQSLQAYKEDGPGSSPWWGISSPVHRPLLPCSSTLLLSLFISLYLPRNVGAQGLGLQLTTLSSCSQSSHTQTYLSSEQALFSQSLEVCSRTLLI